MQCPAQAIRTLEHFASRGAMDIEGLGEKMAYTLFRSGLAKDIADIYDLSAEKLMTLPGIKDKGAGNLMRGIEASKERPLLNVLLALGIRHVGWETAALVAEHIRTLEGLLGVTQESLQGIEGIGPVVANSIVAWAEREQNRELVRRLVAHGINPVHEVRQSTGGPLEGLTIVVTGRLETMSRGQAEDLIRDLGGKVGSSITKATDYLVVGAEAGTKLAKAEKLGTKQLTEEDFGKLVEGGVEALESASDA